VLSAPTPPTTATATSPYRCPECDASWDDEVSRAAAWLDAGARLEGFCGCGSYLVWEHQPNGRWTLANSVAPMPPSPELRLASQ
jgi:hypothetical protein